MLKLMLHTGTHWRVAKHKNLDQLVHFASTAVVKLLLIVSITILTINSVSYPLCNPTESILLTHLNNIHSACDASEDRVFVVQPGGGYRGDEELGPVRSRTYRRQKGAAFHDGGKGGKCEETPRPPSQELAGGGEGGYDIPIREASTPIDTKLSMQLLSGPS